MIISYVFLYIGSVLLVLASSLQRTKHEETLTESSVLFLPLCTLFSLLFLYILTLTINHKILGMLALIIYVPLAYYSTTNNLYYLYEFGEIEIEENVYNIDVSQSEYSELLVNNNEEIETEKVNYMRSPKNYLQDIKNYVIGLVKSITLLDCFIYTFSFALVLLYLISKNWFVTNCVSSSICFCTIREVKLDSVIAGYTLLLILFIYDVLYIIFQSYYKHMVEDLNNPIRISLPINFKKFDLIGFGDIITAAVFLALIKRYCDYKQKQALFVWSFIGFCASCILIIALSYIKKEEMPAMLIISPVLSIFSVISATFSYDIREFIMFKRVKTKKKDTVTQV